VPEEERERGGTTFFPKTELCLTHTITFPRCSFNHRSGVVA
jgi:hypothetical protein